MSKISDKIMNAANALDALPKKKAEPKSALDIVDALYAKIKAAIEKGYSYEEISQMLGEAGIKMSASTLRQYYRSRAKVVKDQTAKKQKAPESSPDDAA